jgi:hypothetical protein
MLNMLKWLKNITFWRWVTGILFIVFSLTYIDSSILSTLGFALAAILLLPPLSNLPSSLIKKPISKQLKIIFLVIFTVIGFKYIPAYSPSKPLDEKAVIESDFIKNSNNVSTSGETKIAPTKTPTPKPSPTPTVTLTPTPTQTPYPTVIPTEPIVYPTNTPVPQQIYIAPTSPPAQQNNSGSYACDCSKTCTQISSCAEAQYLLNTCGCSARDGDHDGIACDSAPLHCQN